jgi:ALG6, ALG8 glycosyltransferase family
MLPNGIYFNNLLNVVLSRLLTAVYFPACLVCAAVLYKNSGQKIACIIAMLLNPALIIIDHGHFQYNNISLGCAVRGKNTVESAPVVYMNFLSYLYLIKSKCLSYSPSSLGSISIFNSSRPSFPRFLSILCFLKSQTNEPLLGTGVLCSPLGRMLTAKRLGTQGKLIKRIISCIYTMSQKDLI